MSLASLGWLCSPPLPEHSWPSKLELSCRSNTLQALAQYRLDCDNLVLEQQFFSGPSRVRLALRGQLFDSRQQAILGTRYFEVVESAASDDPYGGAVTANYASATLLTEMAEWLCTTVRNAN